MLHVHVRGSGLCGALMVHFALSTSVRDAFSYCNLATSGSDMAFAWRSNQMTVGDDVALAWTKGCDDSKGCDLSR